MTVPNRVNSLPHNPRTSFSHPPSHYRTRNPPALRLVLKESFSPGKPHVSCLTLPAAPAPNLPVPQRIYMTAAAPTHAKCILSTGTTLCRNSTLVGCSNPRSLASTHKLGTSLAPSPPSPLPEASPQPTSSALVLPLLPPPPSLPPLLAPLHTALTKPTHVSTLSLLALAHLLLVLDGKDLERIYLYLLPVARLHLHCVKIQVSWQFIRNVSKPTITSLSLV